MHVLLTNDDGVLSPGILALSQAIASIARVTVLAPNHNWSAAGHNKTMHKPLRVEPAQLADGSPALASNGTPSDCVALAVLGVLDAPIDLVVSGINIGANLGQDITYSGTVAGAMEGCISGIPAIAISLVCFDPEADFAPAARVAADAVALVKREGLPSGVFLNLNVPRLPTRDLKGVRVTRLGRRLYRDELVRRLDPRGRPYYWIGGEPPSGEASDGTDIWAVENGFVSLTPVQMDMTAYSLLAKHEHWAGQLAEGLRER